MIWSGALWDLRNELGSYTADRLIYQGLEYVNGNATMHQGRAGILQADQALYGSSHKRDIQNTFAARGVGNYALAVEILGPGFLDPKTTGNYTANATGESGNYSYEWRYRHNGTGSWSTVFATVQTIEWTIGYNDVEFQVKVISGSDSQYDTKYVVSDEILPKAFQENAHSQIPTEFALQQNYPNPFNPETKIQFALPYAEYVQLIIYDMLGREVRRVVDKEMNAGYHSILWNGKDNKGEQVASGVYVYKIIAGEFVVNKKLTLLQ